MTRAKKDSIIKFRVPKSFKEQAIRICDAKSVDLAVIARNALARELQILEHDPNRVGLRPAPPAPTRQPTLKAYEPTTIRMRSRGGF